MVEKSFGTHPAKDGKLPEREALLTRSLSCLVSGQTSWKLARALRTAQHKNTYTHYEASLSEPGEDDPSKWDSELVTLPPLRLTELARAKWKSCLSPKPVNARMTGLKNCGAAGPP